MGESVGVPAVCPKKRFCGNRSPERFGGIYYTEDQRYGDRGTSIYLNRTNTHLTFIAFTAPPKNSVWVVVPGGGVECDILGGTQIIHIFCLGYL